MRISDWSSDVCSSDLPAIGIDEGLAEECFKHEYPLGMVPQRAVTGVCENSLRLVEPLMQREIVIDRAAPFSDRREGVVIAMGHARSPRARSRSEERRVGKEGDSTCRSRGWA